MNVKYDLEKMLEEIKADEACAKPAAKRRLTQEEIRALVRRRKKEKPQP